MAFYWISFVLHVHELLLKSDSERLTKPALERTKRLANNRAPTGFRPTQEPWQYLNLEQDYARSCSL